MVVTKWALQEVTLKNEMWKEIMKRNYEKRKENGLGSDFVSWKKMKYKDSQEESSSNLISGLLT